MSITDDDDNPLWVPQVVLGGMSPPGGGAAPYLLFLKKGALFLARDLTSKDVIDLTLFEVAFVFKKARLVLEKDGVGNSIPHYVDPIPFCRRFEFYEVLLEGKEDDEPVNRADITTGFQNNESIERVNRLDEEPKG